MKPLLAMAWKEWRETRCLLAAGLGLFLVLPLIEAWRSHLAGYPRFEMVAASIVGQLGGLTAMLLGVAVGGRDLRRRAAEFWRAMPVGVGRWWVVKYAVGLAAVLLACGLPLAMELLTNAPQRALPEKTANLLGWGPAYWAAGYSLGFLAGCLVRRPGHATAAGVAALILLHFLPVVVPPLNRFGVPEASAYSSETGLFRWFVDYRWFAGARRPAGRRALVVLRPEQVPFVLAMVGVTVAALATAVVAARRGWAVQSGRRTMFAAVGGTGLLLFASAAYQLATNLPVLAEATLDPHERVVAIHTDGQTGVVITSGGPSRAAAVRTLSVGPQRVSVGPAVGLNNWYGWSAMDRSSSAWFPSHPGVVYAIAPVIRPPDVNPRTYCLFAIQLGGGARADVLSLELWTGGFDTSDFSARSSVAEWYLAGDRLYVSAGEMTAAVDIASARSPKLLWAKPGTAFVEGVRYGERLRIADLDGDGDYAMPALDGVSAEDWLAGTASGGKDQAYDAGRLIRTQGRELTISRQIPLSPRLGRFDAVGRWGSSLLERTLGRRWDTVDAAGGRAYLSTGVYGAGLRDDAHVTVVDVRDPARPRTAGHFAVVEGGPLAVRPLADGRALVGSAGKLQLVGPPPD